MSDPHDQDKALAQLQGAVLGATVVNLDDVRGEAAPVVDEAEEMLFGDKPEEPPADDDEGGGDGTPEEPERDDYGLPIGCPVTPLGKNGKTFFYLDALKQLIALSARDHSNNHFAAMFSPFSDRLEQFWPRMKQVKEKDAKGNEVEYWICTGFKAEEVRNDLMDACSKRGVWDAMDRVRGPGAWADDEGGLIFHCGDVVWSREGQHVTGMIGRHVYPAASPLPRPSDVPQLNAAEGGPAGELLELLQTWSWARSKSAVDATLFLGWIGAALVGGALDWRPMVIVTGDTASGKSTLQKLLGYIMDGAMVQTADSTPAGIYQHVGHSSLPVAIDEIEAERDNRRARGVIKLARLASSGSVMLRGGAEHKGVEFQARSCFLFSAILMPPLDPQDRNRMAILRLGKLETGRKAPTLEPSYFRDLGRRLRRRMFDQWPRFEETLAAYRRALSEAGHNARGCDQFGTLLACADLLQFDQVPDTDTLDEWKERLSAVKWREVGDTRSNAEACLDWLCQSQPEAWRGGSKQTVAELVHEACNNLAFAEDTKKVLQAGGLAVVTERASHKRFLAVPVNHRLVAELFKGSRWAGEADVAGGWSEALGRLEGVYLSRVAKVGGRSAKCTWIPVDQVLSGDNDASADQADTIPTGAS